MNPIASNTLALVVHGDALHAVVVRCAPWGARCRSLGVFPRFLSAPHDAVREVIARAPASARTVLVVPASWCAARPVAINAAQWPGAREEVVSSIASFFPIEPGDAAVGLVERVSASASEGSSGSPASGSIARGSTPGVSGGYLITTRYALLRPWLDTITRALGRTVGMVVSPHMLLPALGLQGAASATVVETLSMGLRAAHRLQWGRVVELGAPDEASSSPSPDSVRAVLPGEGPVDSGARHITPEELGVAAALISRVAPRSFAPLHGSREPMLPPWAPAAAAAVLALAALAGASMTLNGRYERAASELAAELEGMKDELEGARATRARAQSAIDLLAARARLVDEQWGSVLPALAAAAGAVPDSGFVSSLSFTRTRLAVTGESASAGDVLRAVEQSPFFAGARPRSASVPGVTGREAFDIEAQAEAPAADADTKGGA